MKPSAFARLVYELSKAQGCPPDEYRLGQHSVMAWVRTPNKACVVCTFGSLGPGKVGVYTYATKRRGEVPEEEIVLRATDPELVLSEVRRRIKRRRLR